MAQELEKRIIHVEREAGGCPEVLEVIHVNLFDRSKSYKQYIFEDKVLELGHHNINGIPVELIKKEINPNTVTTIGGVVQPPSSNEPPENDVRYVMYVITSYHLMTPSDTIGVAYVQT
ncbi:MAG: hypothetical protein F6K11_29405 [Leptolyngbya sp. SIO3F4]|nr:hypothetical protein [Leptolyngbya sp. SIO3F4]